MLEPFFVTNQLTHIDFSKAPSSWLADVVAGNFKDLDKGNGDFHKRYAAKLLQERER